MLVAVIFLLMKGYYFNTDDQAEHLPQVYQLLDPELYSKDYFVNYSNSVVTVRYCFERVMLFANNTIGLEWFAFIATFLCIALLAWSIMGIAEEMFPKSASKYLAPILLLVVFYGFTVGGNHIIYPSLISSTIAKAFGCYGMWQFFRGRWMLAGFAIGLGGLFQPLVAIQLTALLTGAEFLRQPRSWARLVSFTLPAATLIGILIVPVLLRQSDQKPLETAQYFEILYRFRNYHHYLPSLFPITHYIKAAGLMLAGIAGLLAFRPKHWKFVSVLVGLIVFGLIVYSAFLELNVWPSFGKIQWFKTTIWLGLFGSIIVAEGLTRVPTLRKYFRVLRPTSMLSGVLVLLGLTVLTNSAWIPRAEGKYMVGNRELTDLERMHHWIKENTENDALILIPPNDNSFTCQAKRSVPIHYTAIVHEPKFMLDWYAWYRDIYGVSLDNLELNAKDDAVANYATRNYKGREYGIDLRLDDLSTCQFKDDLGPVLHQEGDWVLTIFKPN